MPWLLGERPKTPESSESPGATISELGARRARRGPLWEVVRSLRPRQWPKNLLVFVAPAAAGVLHNPSDALAACGTFGVFCAASSATYLVNDCVDMEADRHHPRKARRPIASGKLGVTSALMVASVLMTAALVGSWLIAGWELAAVAASYLVVSMAYTLYLKHQPVFEIAAVATGFVLRAVAGGVATHVPLSNWFLVVTSFTALFVTVGKRTAEHRALAESRGHHRPVLESYTPSFLQAALILTATVTVTGYCLWAFGRSGLTSRPGVHAVWIELSVIPVILGVLVVLQLLDGGRGSAPEDLFFQNRPVQLLAICWVALLAVGVYA